MGQAFQEAYRHMNNAIQSACRAEAYDTAQRHDFRALVADWFWKRRSAPFTAEECCDAIRMVHGYHIEKNTIAPRVTELAQSGDLVPVGKKPTRSGKSATAYIHRDHAAKQTGQPVLFDEPETAHYPG
jgi:hypothetical protein